MTRVVTTDTLQNRIADLAGRISNLERALKTMNPGYSFEAAKTPGEVIGKVAVTNNEGKTVGYIAVYNHIT